jgi:hypothetical protein
VSRSVNAEETTDDVVEEAALTTSRMVHSEAPLPRSRASMEDAPGHAHMLLPSRSCNSVGSSPAPMMTRTPLEPSSSTGFGAVGTADGSWPRR